jgi:hypothetical protein
MADGKSRDAWNHTSALMALLANLHRSKGSRAYKPADFHPGMRPRRESLPKASITLLKRVFIDNRPQK